MIQRNIYVRHRNLSHLIKSRHVFFNLNIWRT